MPVPSIRNMRQERTMKDSATETLSESMSLTMTAKLPVLLKTKETVRTTSASHLMKRTTNGILPTKYIGRIRTPISIFTATTLGDHLKMSRTTLSRLRKTREEKPQTARWVVTRPVTSFGESQRTMRLQLTSSEFHSAIKWRRYV